MSPTSPEQADPHTAVHVLLRDLTAALIDKPEALQVHVEATPGGRLAVFRVVVEPSDFGKLIGVRGSHADALRTLFRHIGRKNRCDYFVEFVDPRGRHLADPSGETFAVNPRPKGR